MSHSRRDRSAPGHRSHRSLLAVTLAVSVALGGGCAQELSLRIRIGDRPPNPPELLRAPRELTVQGGVEVDRFRIVLRQIRLESNPTVDDQASPGRTGVLPGPTLVDLSGAQLSPGALTRIIAGVLIGPLSFYELDADTGPVTQDEATRVPALGPLVGQSLIIDGRYQGQPFTFASAMQAVLKSESVFRLGTNHNNIDLNFAPNLWFDDGEGGVLDPTRPENRPRIEANIQGSFSAYEDDDLDGAPDPLG